MTPREKRKQELDALSEPELLQVWQDTFGKEVAWSHRNRAVETILDDKFPGRPTVTVAVRCPKCDTVTPHATKGNEVILGDIEGQRMTCAHCGVVMSVPLKNFQENVDAEDNTDFSILGEEL